jgi:hypothetical protein
LRAAPAAPRLALAFCKASKARSKASASKASKARSKASASKASKVRSSAAPRACFLLRLLYSVLYCFTPCFTYLAFCFACFTPCFTYSLLDLASALHSLLYLPCFLLRLLYSHAGDVSGPHTSADVCDAYVSIRRHTSGPHTSADVCDASVSIRRHTSMLTYTYTSAYSYADVC